MGCARSLLGVNWGDGCPMTVNYFDDETLHDDLRMKLLIVEAADALLEEKPIEKVGVVDICRKAGVSRNTFYRHFRGKDDVVVWLEVGIVNSVIMKIGQSLSLEDGLDMLLCSLSSNAEKLVWLTARSDRGEAFRDECARRMGEFLIRELEWCRGVPMTSKLRGQCRMFPYALVSLVRIVFCGLSEDGLHPAEIAGGGPADRLSARQRKEHARALCDFVPAELKSALGKPRVRSARSFAGICSSFSRDLKLIARAPDRKGVE